MWSEFLIDYCYFIKETISRIFWRLFPTNFTWSILEHFVVSFCLEFLWNCRGDDLKVFCLSIYCTQCTKNEVFHQRFLCRKLRICSRLLKKPTVENIIFCVMAEVKNSFTSIIEWGCFFIKIFLNNFLSPLVYEFSKFIFN